MFESVDDVADKFEKKKYICGNEIATAVFLAEKMGKPILVEGPAGVGKTELAKTAADVMGAELIRLQCYEGLDETKALYEWEYGKQLLYTQILKEKIDELIGGAETLAGAVERISSQEEVFFSRRFVLPRPLLRAITAEKRTALLIDEVDRADPEFEAFLLEILSDFQVSIPELGTISAAHVPFVVLTSNNTREVSDALKRRCLYLFINYPSHEQELRIVRLKVPGAGERLAREIVSVVQSVRTLDLKKTPSISETLDWAAALVIIGAASLTEDLLNSTLNVVLKFEEDIEEARKRLPALLRAAHGTENPELH
ncbi:MAG: MoxR family ATPase [bacterium]